MNATTARDEAARSADGTRRNRALGAILVDAGRLTQEDVAEIEAFAGNSGLLFGEAAVRMKRITTNDLEFALARQFSYPVLPVGPGGAVSAEVVAAYEPHCAAAEDLRTVRSRLVIDWLNRTDRNLLTVVSSCVTARAAAGLPPIWRPCSPRPASGLCSLTATCAIRASTNCLI